MGRSFASIDDYSGSGGFSLPRFTYNNKKINARSLNYVSEDGIALQISAQPASFKKADGKYVVDKNGYILFEFVNFESEDNKVDWAARKTFVMGIKSVDIMLGLDIHRAFDQEIDGEGEIAFHKP